MAERLTVKKECIKEEQNESPRIKTKKLLLARSW
jgi:hypothetical protein